ncbi:MAG: 2,4-dienoyl-CoA reductase, partial [Acidimicrobiia bacterium]|nr:2,4-dienoyl-CoA reductase [Acidimicrobiia bacterium]
MNPAEMTLFTPIEVGSVTVRNRVVSTAHGAYLDFYRPGVAPDQYVAYQERRARGGCGLIILQTMQVASSSQSFGHFMWEREDILRKLGAMADAVHAHGTKIVVQIGHFGAQFRSDGNEDLAPRWAMSPILSPSGWEQAHEMTSEEIEEVIQGFVDTAKVVVEAGIDGVELHGTHGYLVQQSFSPWANARTDEWGEPLRFVDVLTSRVREALGSDPIVGLRISAEDWIKEDFGGLGPDGLRAVAGHVCES